MWIDLKEMKIIRTWYDWLINYTKYPPPLPAPLCKGGDPRFQARHVNGEGTFFEILEGGTKRRDSIIWVSSEGELVKVGQFCLNQLQKQPFQTLTLQNINSLTVAVTFSYSYML